MQERSHTDYGLSKFIGRESNILFVTGYSASGKSTIAKDYCKRYDAIYVELDMIHQDYLSYILDDTSLIFKEMPANSKEFWMGYLKKYNYGIIISYENNKKLITTKAYKDATIPERVINVIKYAKSLNKRFVIEGVQCYLYTEVWPYVINDPVIIMNTSINQSRVSNVKRAGKLDGINDIIWLKRYYHRQRLLLDKFKEKLNKEDSTMTLEAILESYIIPLDGHLNDFDYVSEGFFRDDTKTKTGFGEDRDKALVNTYITGKNKLIPVPSKLWPKGFAALKTGYASEGMIKNGVKVITQYVNTIEKAYEFAKQNEAAYAAAVDNKNNEEKDAIIKKFHNIVGPIIATNRNVNTIFTGPHSEIPESFRKAVVAPFTKYQQIYEEVVELIGGKLAKHNSASTVKKMFKGKKMDREFSKTYLYGEVMLYCKDLWLIVSKYLNTNE